MFFFGAIPGIFYVPSGLSLIHIYKKIRNEFTGVLTGKGLAYGGSLIRPEATGYGVVYFAEQMLKTIGQDFRDKVICVSGFGNVAWGVVKKATELGGKVVTISGPDGYIYDRNVQTYRPRDRCSCGRYRRWRKGNWLPFWSV